MRSIIAIVLSVLSVAAILGTSTSASASTGDNGNNDVLLTKEQWEGFMSVAEECENRGYDSCMTAQAIVGELEATVGVVLETMGIPEESSAAIIETIAWMAVQSQEISTAVTDLRDDGVTHDVLREVLRPMVDHYRSLSTALAETLGSCGLTCYVPAY